MQVDIVTDIAGIEAREWNRLVGNAWPFLRHEFLLAAERGGCVSPATGWSPRHVVLREGGKLRAAMPLYEKTHSWGEFVFDWAWAEAYRRAGIEYYPKLVSAVPFTPAPSRRLLLRDPAETELAGPLLGAARELAEHTGHSSLHVLFPTTEELPLLEQAGLKLRKDCQFHWHNRGYRSFDDFLQTFSSRKRKKARRDRRRMEEQHIAFRWLGGAEADRAVWNDVFPMISNTFLRRGSLPYFDDEFFVEISRRMPANVLVVLAERRGSPIAAAVFYVGRQTLYGRYWGNNEEHDALHFETCYYQGIEYCISRGLEVFEPGTQGEHKISRGFLPVPVWSAHWLARPAFFDAVGDYLEAEQRHVDRYMDAAASLSPYRNPDDARCRR